MSSETSPLVKVVITTYNRRSWAADAIDSALAQTHRPIRVVIVDDASIDGTAQLARSYQEQHPDKVTAICKPENRGLADSIATGLRAESGADFVAILTDDDARTAAGEVPRPSGIGARVLRGADRGRRWKANRRALLRCIREARSRRR